MLIVVNAIFSMFSFCKLLYLYMFRRGAREAVRGVSCFPADRADLQMPFGRFLFSHRLRRFAQMPVRGVLFSTQIAPLAPRCKREFCYNVTCYMLQ